MRINKYTRHTLILIAIGASSQILTAQMISGNSKRIADGYYNSADYSSAAKYYEQAIVPGGKDVNYVPYQVKRDRSGTEVKKADPRHESMYRLAESYRLMNDYMHAEEWYDKLEEEVAGQYPLASFYLGVSLRANGKYKEAETVFNRFLQRYAAKDSFYEKAQSELANCVFIQDQLQHPNTFVSVARMGDNINTEGANYAAGWQNENTLVFTSTRANGNTTKSGKPIHTNSIYKTSQQDGVWGEVAKLDIPMEKDLQQGGVSFTPDGSKMFFTGWSTDKDGKKTSSIYVSEKNGTQWLSPVKAGGDINPEKSNSRQPNITSDGKYLFFASDRAGGNGGFDIWYAKLDTRSVPQKAINAGSVINTKDDDEAPFYHTESKTLILASKGRTGLGGFDLYISQGDISNWSVPQNAGYPVNSVKDDIYFMSKGADLWKNAYISSDRSSLCCLELFSINKIKAKPVEMVKTEPPVVPAVEEKVPEKPSLVTHSVLFAYNDATISGTSHAYLDSVVAYLKENSGVKLEIGAHTDGNGTVAYNLKLSERRAMACKDYLVKCGISADRLVAKGYGECCSLVKEMTEDGKDISEAREQNRRVEIKIY